jgi:hypothetical protein
VYQKKVYAMSDKAANKNASDTQPHTLANDWGITSYFLSAITPNDITLIKHHKLVRIISGGHKESGLAMVISLVSDSPAMHLSRIIRQQYDKRQDAYGDLPCICT